MQKPSVGRIVHYYPSENEPHLFAEVGEPVAAIITRVWTDECVNLQLFTNSGRTPHLTSRCRGEGDGEWRWPPRN